LGTFQEMFQHFLICIFWRRTSFNWRAVTAWVYLIIAYLQILNQIYDIEDFLPVTFTGRVFRPSPYEQCVTFLPRKGSIYLKSFTGHIRSWARDHKQMTRRCRSKNENIRSYITIQTSTFLSESAALVSLGLNSYLATTNWKQRRNLIL
jgi:hypothetical protein